MTWNGVRIRGLGVALAIAFALVPAACQRSPEYPQSTPEEVVASAVRMVQDGRPERLARLVHADSREMRIVLQRLETLLGSLQSLAAAVEARFPKEVAELRERGVQETAAGLGGAIAKGAAAVRERSRESQRDAFESGLRRVLADPYGWISRNAGRLSTVPVSDDSAAVLLDGAPVPPIGLLLTKDGDRWWIVPPLQLPVVARYVPQTRREWAIVGYMITAANNAVVDLAADVRAGRARELGDVAALAGEKAFLPMAAVAAAYGREMRVRTLRERLLARYRAALRAWETSREAAGGAPLGPEVRAAVDGVAVEVLDVVARQDGPSPVRAEEPERVGSTVQAWLDEAGLAINLESPPTEEQAAALARAWRNRPKASKRRSRARRVLARDPDGR